MDASSAVLAAAALFAMFALHVTALVGLTLGRDRVPVWMAAFTVSASGPKRVAAIVWTAAISLFSQVAAAAVILRPSLDGPARTLFLAECVGAAALTYWLVRRRNIAS